MNQSSRTPLIAVVGGNRCTPAQYEMAQDVGRLLAERGYGVVCGGRTGVMEAACKGAYAAGGLTVGVLPGTDASEANPYVRVALPTGLGEARNALVVRAGQGVIAIGGEYGTLSEIALALKAGKPVVAIGSWELRNPTGDTVAIERAQNAADGVEALVRALAGRA